MSNVNVYESEFCNEIVAVKDPLDGWTDCIKM
jgi:hypothetical protein